MVIGAGAGAGSVGIGEAEVVCCVVAGSGTTTGGTVVLIGVEVVGIVTTVAKVAVVRLVGSSDEVVAGTGFVAAADVGAGLKAEVELGLGLIFVRTTVVWLAKPGAESADEVVEEDSGGAVLGEVAPADRRLLATFTSAHPTKTPRVSVIGSAKQAVPGLQPLITNFPEVSQVPTVPRIQAICPALQGEVGSRFSKSLLYPWASARLL